VHYTVAVDLAATADSMSTQFPQPVSPLIHQCYSNRAACFLKLGQHERALADADSCIATAPDAYVKGHFRRGLALHALGRYAEALPSLGKALRLESPKAKASLAQINEAITFAERKLQVEIRERLGK
jgi:tetratricopeptide (TPR) repeat protein